MRIERVLLVCTGNTCRSPMAEALLRHLWQEAAPGWSLSAGSAGTAAVDGVPATPHAISALRARGLDLTAHRSRPVSPQTLAGVDLILTMTGRHKSQILMFWPHLSDRVYTIAEYAGSGQDVPDPFGGTLADYDQTAATLEDLLRAVVARISREGQGQQ